MCVSYWADWAPSKVASLCALLADVDDGAVLPGLVDLIESMSAIGLAGGFVSNTHMLRN